MSLVLQEAFTMRMVGGDTEIAARAKALIASSFRNRLNAFPNVNHKNYLVIETFLGGSSRIAACSSITFGGEQRLFSEDYLPERLEERVSREFGIRCPRRAICEIGSLSTDPSLMPSVRSVVAFFPWYATRLGCEFALVTVTSYMRFALAKAGAPFVPFCSSNPSVLSPEEKARWGSYYDYDPQTGVIDLKQLAFLNAQTSSAFRGNGVTIGLGRVGRVEVCS